MNRRLTIALLACCASAHVRAQDDNGRPRHKISARLLHEALSARFPVRFGVPPLLEVEVSAPRLLLVPSRNQFGAALRADATATSARPIEAGELDVVFDVYYEPGDRTIRARRPEVLAVRWPGLPAEMVQALQAVLPVMARQALGDIVLHSFSARELALPDAMGLEPQEVKVLDDGLLVLFGPRKAR